MRKNIKITLQKITGPDTLYKITRITNAITVGGADFSAGVGDTLDEKQAKTLTTGFYEVTVTTK
jgi:hypothetical protein